MTLAAPVNVGDGADVDDEARSRGPAGVDPTICVGCAYPTHARAIIALATTATAPGMATQGLPTYVSLS